jgi:hypothetical protein
MLSDVRKHAAMLKMIHKARPSLRRSLINMADRQLIHCICECTSNVLKGNVDLSPTEKRRLARHRKILRRLVKKGENWKAKRKIIAQKGGFLLPLLAPIVGALLSSFIHG